MGIAKVCDKCRKIIVGSGEYWDSDESYTYANEDEIEINGQYVILHMQFTLECGDHLDLCNDCAREFLDIKVGKLNKKKRRGRPRKND